MLLLSGLTGCVVAPAPAPAPVPLVAVPGPAKTEAAFHQDDAACRAALVTLPTGNEPSQPNDRQPAAQPAATQAPAYPPGVVYLRCMASRGNTVEPYGPVQPVLYGEYPAYPVYAGIGYGFPFYYGGFGYFGGFGYYGGFRDRFYGGFGREGFREGFRGEGFRDRFRGEGFRGDGFRGGEFGRGGRR